MENSFCRLISRLNTARKRFNALKERSIEIIQTEVQKGIHRLFLSIVNPSVWLIFNGINTYN